MSDKIRIPYEAAKNILLEILQNEALLTDDDVLKRLTIILDNQKVDMKPLVLSRIKIDEKSRVYFSEYSTKEVQMSYLPKTLFFFFLFHPEGHCFKQLCDFKQELYLIYQIIAVDKNVDAYRIKKSIDNLTGPLNNRIHEVCSIIRKTLLMVVPQEALEYYCIVGKRGDKHSIALQRSLVFIENEELRKFINY